MVNVRLDICNTDRGPELRGLWIQGWGWLVGGGQSGDITISAELRGEARADRQALIDLSLRYTARRLDRRLWPVWESVGN